MRREQREEWPFHHASLSALFRTARRNPAYQPFNKTANIVELLVAKLKRYNLEGSELDTIILNALTAVEEQGFIYGFINATSIMSEVHAGCGREDNPWVNWDPDPGDEESFIWRDLRRNQCDAHTEGFLPFGEEPGDEENGEDDHDDET